MQNKSNFIRKSLKIDFLKKASMDFFLIWFILDSLVYLLLCGEVQVLGEFFFALSQFSYLTSMEKNARSNLLALAQGLK